MGEFDGTEDRIPDRSIRHLHDGSGCTITIVGPFPPRPNWLRAGLGYVFNWLRLYRLAKWADPRRKDWEIWVNGKLHSQGTYILTPPKENE